MSIDAIKREISQKIQQKQIYLYPPIAIRNGIQGVTRFGFSVGKRAGNAVVRNTIKRRTREAVRHIPIVDGWDLVFIAKSRANKAKYNQLLSSVHNLLEKASLLNMGTTSQE